MTARLNSRVSIVKRVGLPAIAIASALHTQEPAQAGAFCGDPVQSGNASGLTQAEAEKAAISWWSSRAGAVGRGYEKWENAEGAQVSCKEQPNKKIVCQASGRPCLPDGQRPENLPKVDL